MMLYCKFPLAYTTHLHEMDDKLQEIAALANSVKAETASSNVGNKLKPLPADFEPTEFSVICARGKRAYESPGNVWFRALVEQHSQQYSKANNKIEKSIVVTEVIEIVRKASPQGSFIRKVNGRWHEVNDAIARERVGQTFRDTIDNKYRSSCQNKKRQRARRRSSASESAASSLRRISAASGSSISTAASAVVSSQQQSVAALSDTAWSDQQIGMARLTLDHHQHQADDNDDTKPSAVPNSISVVDSASSLLTNAEPAIAAAAAAVAAAATFRSQMAPHNRGRRMAKSNTPPKKRKPVPAVSRETPPASGSVASMPAAVDVFETRLDCLANAVNMFEQHPLIVGGSGSASRRSSVASLPPLRPSQEEENKQDDDDDDDEELSDADSEPIPLDQANDGQFNHSYGGPWFG